MRFTSRACAIALSVSLITVTVTGTAFGEAKVFRFNSARRVKVQGRDHLTVIVEPAAGGKAVRFVLPNGEPDRYDPPAAIADTIKGLHTGQFVKIDSTGDAQNPELSTLEVWTPKTGEDTPHGYVFVESHLAKDDAGKTIVVLSKFEQPRDYVASSADGDLTYTLQRLNKDEVVWAETGAGDPPTIVVLAPYQEPRQGKFLKLVPVDVDGQKGFAANIEFGGGTITCILPMKTKDGKSSPDPRLSTAVHRFHAGSEVLFRTRDVGDKVFLLDIEPPPKVVAQTPKAPTHQGAGLPGIPNRTGGGVGIGGTGVPGGF